MSLSGLEPEPKRYGVRMWWETLSLERGAELTARVHLTVHMYLTEAEATHELRSARRGKWVHPTATAWGAEPVGFQWEAPGQRISAAEYVRQVRDGGSGDPVAAQAIAACLSLFREPPEQ